MKDYGDIDSKFRFVILASKRAKQLLAGARPKIKSKSKNLIRLAQEEVEKGLIKYEIVQPDKEELAHEEEEIFIGEELGEAEEGELKGSEEEVEEVKAAAPEKKKKTQKKPAPKKAQKKA